MVLIAEWRSTGGSPLSEFAEKTILNTYWTDIAIDVSEAVLLQSPPNY